MIHIFDIFTSFHWHLQYHDLWHVIAHEYSRNGKYRYILGDCSPSQNCLKAEDGRSFQLRLHEQIVQLQARPVWLRLLTDLLWPVFLTNSGCFPRNAFFVSTGTKMGEGCSDVEKIWDKPIIELWKNELQVGWLVGFIRVAVRRYWTK